MLAGQNPSISLTTACRSCDAGGRCEPGANARCASATRLRLRDLALPGAKRKLEPVPGGVCRWALRLDLDRFGLEPSRAFEQGGASLASLKSRARALGPACPGQPALDVPPRIDGRRRALEPLEVARKQIDRNHIAEPLASLALQHPLDPDRRRPGARLEPEPGWEPEDDRSALQVDLIVGTVGNRTLPIVMPLKPRHAIVDGHQPAEQVGPARELRGFDQRDGRLGRTGPETDQGAQTT